MAGSKRAEKQDALRSLRLPGRAGEAPSALLADLDTQLMLRAREGDQNAAETLIRRNHERVARYIGRLVRDPRWGEDLTQDVFLQALSKAHNYQPTARVSTWLYRIATNLALNHLRDAAHRRTKGAADDRPFDVADHHVAPPDSQMNLDELRRQVADAIQTLPVNQRIALTLFQYEECSYEQIAEVLEVSVEAVRCLLMRARTALRARLNALR